MGLRASLVAARGGLRSLAGYDCVALVGHMMSSCSPQSPRICGSSPSSDQIRLQLSNQREANCPEGTQQAPKGPGPHGISSG
jgi:hypothetical protein